jgi:alpha-1,6-mannosyltransferase
MLLEEMGWTTLFLLLFATSWLMPWYCSILITFAALIPQSRIFGLTTLAFGLSSSAQYALGMNSSLKSLVSIGLPVLTLIISTIVLRSKPTSPSASSQELTPLPEPDPTAELN